MKNKTENIKSPEPIEDDSKMTDKQMNNLLVELYNLKNWEALKRFINAEMIKAENVLCTIDLATKQSEASRCQGIRMGLFSVIKYIEDEVGRRKKEEDGGEKVPNYNGY